MTEQKLRADIMTTPDPSSIHVPHEGANLIESAADLIKQQAARIAALESEREVEWGVMWVNVTDIGASEEDVRICATTFAEEGARAVRRTVGPWKEVKDDD